MSLTFSHAYSPFQSGRSASDTELNALELAINAKLPSDYRSFLTMVNGGSLQPFSFELEIPGYQFDEKVHSLEYLYDIREVQRRSQIQMEPSLRNIPPGRLAIGTTVSELTITLNIEPHKAGMVEVWVRDTFNVWNEGANRIVVPLADSFTGFLSLLADLPGAYDVWRWAEYDKDAGAVTRITLP